MSTAISIITAARFSNVPALEAAAAVTGVPLHVATAFVEKESRGANVYGHDRGGALYGISPVTASNYATFYRLVVDERRLSNGVGPMQITYWKYHPQAKEQGLRLWVPFDNYLFGLRIIARNLAGSYTTASLQRAGTLYNAGNLTNGINAYGRDVAVKASLWKTRLSGATRPYTLREGTGGPAVQPLHAGLLSRFPSYAGPIRDSGEAAKWLYGPATKAVVEEFQRRVRIPADGIAGPLTRGHLTVYGITL